MKNILYVEVKKEHGQPTRNMMYAIINMVRAYKEGTMLKITFEKYERKCKDESR